MTTRSVPARNSTEQSSEGGGSGWTVRGKAAAGVEVVVAVAVEVVAAVEAVAAAEAAAGAGAAETAGSWPFQPAAVVIRRVESPGRC